MLNSVIPALRCGRTGRRCMGRWDFVAWNEQEESILRIGVLLETVGAVAAAGLTAVSPAQVIGLGEDDVWTFVVELVGFGRWGCRGLVAGVRSWEEFSHSSIVADCRNRDGEACNNAIGRRVKVGDDWQE
jgi:hypothetical protein